MSPAPRPMPILGTAEFDAANPPRILATMIDVVREAEHPLSEDGVVGRTLARMCGRVELDDGRGAFIGMLTSGFLTRFPVGEPRRYEVTPGPTARVLDIELNHELSFWLGRMDQRARGARLPWPLA